MKKKYLYISMFLLPLLISCMESNQPISNQARLKREADYYLQSASKRQKTEFDQIDLELASLPLDQRLAQFQNLLVSVPHRDFWKIENGILKAFYPVPHAHARIKQKIFRRLFENQIITAPEDVQDALVELALNHSELFGVPSMIAYYIYRLQKNKSDEIITHYAKRIIKTLAPHASTFTIFKTCYALIDLYKEDSKATCKALVHLYELGINPIQARDMNNIRLIEYIANNHLKCALFTDELVNLFGLFG